MRFLILLTLLSVLVSCGQGGSSSSSSGERQNEEYSTDIRHTDLIDVSMDVLVETTGNKIVFKQSVVSTRSGVRATCNASVAAGESYDYSLRGSRLTVFFPSGERVNFERDSGDGSSIVGTWTGKSNIGEMMVLRKMSFLTENRLVMRTHCEG